MIVHNNKLIFVVRSATLSELLVQAHIPSKKSKALVLMSTLSISCNLNK